MAETGQPLTAEECMALPDDTPIIVRWSGGNGPHRCTLVRDKWGAHYAAPRGDENGPLRFHNPITFVGQEDCHTHVWVDREHGPEAGSDV